MTFLLRKRIFFKDTFVFAWKRSFSVSHCAAADPVGFVGLGNMGAHMARNLLNSGHQVIVYDLNASAVSELTQAGASSADSPAAVASEVKRVVTMLPSSPHVKQVYNGQDGILSSIQPGTLCVDSSTIDPSVSVDMEALASDRGAVYMDAPVSGGVVAARDALLTFMVGGSEARFPEAEALLSHMGKNVVHTGACGTGQAAKICNNMLLGISMIGTAETMNLGIKLGLDPQMLAKILNMSSGRCWSTEAYNPCPGVCPQVPASNGYKGGFGVTLMAKDLGLAQNASTATQSPTPMGSLAHQFYRILSNTKHRGNDFTSVFPYLQEQEPDN